MSKHLSPRLPLSSLGFCYNWAGLSFSKLCPLQNRWLVLSSFIVVLRQFPLLLVEGFEVQSRVTVGDTWFLWSDRFNLLLLYSPLQLLTLLWLPLLLLGSPDLTGSTFSVNFTLCPHLLCFSHCAPLFVITSPTFMPFSARILLKCIHHGFEEYDIRM